MPRFTGNGWVAYLDPQKACCAAAPLTRVFLVNIGLFILLSLPILEGSTAMFCTGPFFDRVRKIINGPKYMGIMTSEAMPRGYWMAYARSYAKEKGLDIFEDAEYLKGDARTLVGKMAEAGSDVMNELNEWQKKQAAVPIIDRVTGVRRGSFLVPAACTHACCDAGDLYCRQCGASLTVPGGGGTASVELTIQDDAELGLDSS
jgi:hypothetical protein